MAGCGRSNGHGRAAWPGTAPQELEIDGNLLYLQGIWSGSILPGTPENFLASGGRIPYTWCAFGRSILPFRSSVGHRSHRSVPSQRSLDVPPGLNKALLLSQTRSISSTLIDLGERREDRGSHFLFYGCYHMVMCRLHSTHERGRVRSSVRRAQSEP